MHWVNRRFVLKKKTVIFEELFKGVIVVTSGNMEVVCNQAEVVTNKAEVVSRVIECIMEETIF